MIKTFVTRESNPHLPAAKIVESIASMDYSYLFM